MIKKDNKFKEKWEKQYKNLSIEFQYLWRVVNLLDKPYFLILNFVIFKLFRKKEKIN